MTADFGVFWRDAFARLGLSGKLQQVMRDEKDTDAHFLMIQQSIEQTHGKIWDYLFFTCCVH